MAPSGSKPAYAFQLRHVQVRNNKKREKNSNDKIYDDL